MRWAASAKDRFLPLLCCKLTRNTLPHLTVCPGPRANNRTICICRRGVFIHLCRGIFRWQFFWAGRGQRLRWGNWSSLPAEQTPIIAFEAVEPCSTPACRSDAMRFCRAYGSTVGAQLVADPSPELCSPVVPIRRNHQPHLASRRAGIIPFIAETGGLNAMIADSSALRSRW